MNDPPDACLTVTAVSDGACTRVSASGEIDVSTASQLHHHVDLALDTGCDVELDYSGVTFIDSIGVSSLLIPRQRADARERSIRLVATSAPVDRVLELCGLAQHFQ